MGGSAAASASKVAHEGRLHFAEGPQEAMGGGLDKEDEPQMPSGDLLHSKKEVQAASEAPLCLKKEVQTPPGAPLRSEMDGLAPPGEILYLRKEAKEPSGEAPSLGMVEEEPRSSTVEDSTGSAEALDEVADFALTSTSSLEPKEKVSKNFFTDAKGEGDCRSQREIRRGGAPNSQIPEKRGYEIP